MGWDYSLGGHDIVVIGASAGGLDALNELLTRIPQQLSAAIFLVLHRSMPHALVNLLSKTERIPVHSAQNLLRFQTGNVYICPGDHYLSIENGYMRVEHSPREGIHRPSINALFRSAALTYGRRVLGILLTGMMDDGVAGLWEIKRRGGIAVVQDPSEARWPDMPSNAIANVSVDYVLRVEEIAQKLIDLTMPPLDGSVASTSAGKVLIVEDERVVAEGLKDQLEDSGYQVSGSCGSGERAIELAAEVRPDLVLMDIRLAGALTGIEAARRIWEQFQIPVIYITAHADADTLEQVKTTETYGYIVKPFHPKAVHAAIQVALDRREKETRVL